LRGTQHGKEEVAVRVEKLNSVPSETHYVKPHPDGKLKRKKGRVDVFCHGEKGKAGNSQDLGGHPKDQQTIVLQGSTKGKLQNSYGVGVVLSDTSQDPDRA